MKVFISADEAKLHKISVDRVDDLVLLRCSSKKMAKRMKETIKTFLIANSLEEEEDHTEEPEGTKPVIGLNPNS